MKVTSVAVVAPQPSGKGMFVTDGTRHAFVTPTRLTLRDGNPRTFALERPTKTGKEVELLSLAMAPDGDAIWAIWSDTFAVAAGRFVARLTWSGKKAAWGPLKSPYPCCAGRARR